MFGQGHQNRPKQRQKCPFGTIFCQKRPIGQIEVLLTTPYDGFKRALPRFEPDTFPPRGRVKRPFNETLRG